MFHKILNNVVDISVHHRLQVRNISTLVSATHEVRQLKTKLYCYKYSFLPVTIAWWNILPHDFVKYNARNTLNMHYPKSVHHHNSYTLIWDSLHYCAHI